MSHIVEANKFVEEDHAMLFVRLADGTVDCLEFGHHHPKQQHGAHHHDAKHAAAHHADKKKSDADHHHHGAHDHKGHDHHSQGHHAKHDEAAEPPAHHTGKGYTVRVWAPFSEHPKGNIGVPKNGWVKTVQGAFTTESFNALLKKDWYNAEAGVHFFHDEGTFLEHCFAILTKQGLSTATA